MAELGGSYNTSSLEQLYDSVYNVILKLPHDTIIYPGHHYGFSRQAELDFNIKKILVFFNVIIWKNLDR